MAWYDSLLILAFVFGILLVAFGHFHSKKWVWGIILVLGAAIAKVIIWIMGNT